MNDPNSKSEDFSSINCENQEISVNNQMEYLSRTTRLMIHKMILTNFKSFKGTTEIGPFNTNFTSIIGPNGSGKSNTLDAIQFVFSKKSSSLRAKNLAELIYNSRGDKASFCKVEIVFWVVPVDFCDNNAIKKTNQVIEEFTIGRYVPRSGSSTYFINGDKSSTQAVVSLLKKHNVDLDNNRFLILQGEVESIATKNNLKLMDYMEEVIGTYKYKEPIEQLGVALEKYREEAAAKLTDAVNLEKILEKSRDKFNDSLRAARDRLEISSLNKEIFVIKNNIYKSQINQLKQEIENFNSEIKSLKDKIENGEKTVKENEILLDNERKNLSKHKELLSKQNEEEKSLSNEKTFTIQQKKLKNKKIIKHKELLNTSEKQQQDLEKEIEKSEKKIEYLKKKKLEAEKALGFTKETLRIKFEEIESKLKPIQSSIDQVKKELSPSTLKIQSMKLTLEEKKQLLQSKNEKENQLKQDEEAMSSSLEKLIITISNNENELNESKSKLSNSINESSRIQEEINKLEKSLNENKLLLQDSENKLNQLLSERKDERSGNIVYQKVSQKNFEGFHDRVGNLASIDKKYNNAISNVMFNSNNLVVENGEIFSNIVSFLKQEKLHANFEDLSAVNRNYKEKALARFESPKDAPRLYDLLQIRNDEYKPLFYKSLGDTLVATDLKRARELAFGNLKKKVVTLNGEVLDPRGSMTSGVRAKGNVLGNTLPKTNKADIIKLENQIKELKQIISDIQIKLAQINEVKTKTLQDINELNFNIQILERQIQQNITKKKKILKDLEALKTDLQKIQQTSSKETIKEIEYLKISIEKSESECSELTKNLKHLEDKEKSVKGTQCNDLENQILTIEKEISEMDKDKVKSDLQINSSKDKISKLKSRTIAAEKEIIELEKEVSKLNEKEEQLLKEISEIVEKNEALSLWIDEKSKEIHEYETIHEKNIAKLGRLKERFNLEMKKVDDIEKKIKGIQEIQKANDLKLSEANENLQNKIVEIKTYIPSLQNPFEIEIDSQDDIDSNQIRTIFESFKHFYEIESQDPMEDIEEQSNTSDYENNLSILEDQIQIVKQRLQNNENRGLELITSFISNKHKYITKRYEANKSIEERESCFSKYQKLCEDRKSLFLEGFAICDKRMRQIFRSFTQEGDATLQLLDPQNPFEGGILFNVRPPGKSWREIQNLSGGEKTLSSLALVFGMHHFRPTPIYILDEIDAALDFKNVSIIGNYIQEQATNAQFIVISLRNHMFDLADRLIGVYKTLDVSKIIVIEASNLERKIQQNSTHSPSIRFSPQKQRKRRRLSYVELDEFM